jgi:hypothetical protein
MSQDNLRQHDDSLPSDPLDELLASAAWPVPRPEQLSRLRASWQTRANLARFRRRSMMAAAVLLVAGLAIWHHRTSNNNLEMQSGPKLHVAEKPVPSSIEDNVATPEFESPPKAIASTRSRLPSIQPSPAGESALDQLLVLSVDRIRRESKTATAIRPDNDRLNEAIESLITGTSTLQELQQSLAPQAAAIEPQLVELVRHSNGERQTASLKILASIGTVRSLAVFMEVRENAELRREATRGVTRLAPPIAIARLAVQETDGEIQKVLLSGLLERNTREAVDLFLNLAGNPRLAQATFDSLAGVQNAPVDLLIDTLHAPQVSRRLLAAKVLGGLRDPIIGQRLIAMAVQGDSRREVLVAMLSSADPQATRFLASGRSDPNWAAQIQAAASDAQPSTIKYQEI